LSKRILIANDDRRPHLIGKGDHAVLGIPPQYEPDSTPAQPVRDVTKTLDQELIVTEVRPLDERIQPEEDDNRLSEGVPQLDRHVERRVVDAPLRALHPVHDAGTIRVWTAGTPDADSWMVPESVNHAQSQFNRQRAGKQKPKPEANDVRS